MFGLSVRQISKAVDSMTSPECPSCKKVMWPGYDWEYLKISKTAILLECATCDFFIIYARWFN